MLFICENSNPNKTKICLIDTENRLVFARGGGGGSAKMGKGGQKIQTFGYKICHGDIMYSIVIIINNTVFCI